MTASPKSANSESAEATFVDQLRLALAAADLGDWVWNAQADVVKLSPHAAEIFGIAPALEIDCKALMELLHVDDRERVRLEATRSMEKGMPYDIEYRVTNRAGRLRWVSAKGRATFSPDGIVTGMVGVVHDITRRKLLEAEQRRLALALQNRVNEWQSLFDTAPIPIWLAHDAECKVVTGNHYANTILGVPNGTNISATAPPGEKVPYEIWQNGRPITPEEFPLRIACFKGIPVRNCEQEVRTPDGRRVSVLISAVALYNDQQQIRGALATALDITERKKSESALRESEQRFRLMADASPALIWIAGPDKLCTWVNKAWLGFVGKPLESQLGEGWTENVHPDDLQKCLQTYLGSFESRSEFELEYRLQRFDGEYRWLLTKARPLMGAGDEFAGFIGSCVDVTENRLRRKELEQLVAERTSQMKESIAQLETFSYTVSHDMRAPLRSMAGFSSALLEDYGDRLDDLGKDYLKRIIQSALKLDLLIEHVLSYSKVATGKIPLRETDLGRAIAAVLAENPQFGGDKVDISLSLTKTLVKANEQMLLQIFSILLLNAAKFVAPGVKPKIRVASEECGSMVKITIEDNGIGVAPEHQARIFDVFTKLHSEHEYAGTGIGLAIAKKAVQMLGGEIGLESEPGRGSRFWFTLKA